jgi:hypothetical protein
MKSVVFVACALGFGFMPAIFGFVPASALSIVIAPVLLGLIYFVLHGKDWPTGLVPWLFACIAVSRVAAYGWLNSRRGRQGSLVDGDVWVCGGLAAVCFAFMLYKWMRNQSEARGVGES